MITFSLSFQKRSTAAERVLLSYSRMELKSKIPLPNRDSTFSCSYLYCTILSLSIRVVSCVANVDRLYKYGTPEYIIEKFVFRTRQEENFITLPHFRLLEFPTKVIATNYYARCTRVLQLFIQCTN